MPTTICQVPSTVMLGINVSYFSPHPFEEILKTKRRLRKVGSRSPSHEMSRSECEPRSVCLLCPSPYNPLDQQHLFETSLRASGPPLSIVPAHPCRGGQSLVCWTDHCPSLGFRWMEEANPLATRHNLEGPAVTH